MLRGRCLGLLKPNGFISKNLSLRGIAIQRASKSSKIYVATLTQMLFLKIELANCVISSIDLVEI